MPKDTSPNWSYEAIKTHQEKCPILSQVLKWVKDGSRPPFDEVTAHRKSTKYWWARFKSLHLCAKGLLVYTWKEEDGKTRDRIILPESLQRLYMREIHDCPNAGHLGMSKTWARAKRSNFMWISMRDYVRQYVRGCIICQRTKPSFITRNSLLNQFPIGARLELIGMDLVGPLPCTKNKNKFILTIIDYWTRWCEAIPIPDKKAETVAQAFMSQFVARYGCPLSILSDRGKEFVNETFHSCCRELMDNYKVKTTAYHAQTNGLCERLNGTIEKMLRAYVAESQTDWDQKLPFVMMAYRSAVQETLGETPYAMTFGEEMRIPLDWVFGNPDQVPKSKVEYVKDLRTCIEAAYEKARKHMQAPIRRQKKGYDKRAKHLRLQIGDTVMVHNKERKKGRNPALQAKWTGPFTVVSILNDVTLGLKRNPTDKKEYTVHIDRCKKVVLNNYDGSWAKQPMAPTPQENVPQDGGPNPIENQPDCDGESIISDGSLSDPDEQMEPEPQGTTKEAPLDPSPPLTPAPCPKKSQNGPTQANGKPPVKRGRPKKVAEGPTKNTGLSPKPEVNKPGPDNQRPVRTRRPPQRLGWD